MPSGRKRRGFQIWSSEVAGGVGVVLFTGRPPLRELADRAKIYWVREDTVYWVNRAARDCAPHLGQGPANLTPDAVLEAAFYE